MNDKLNLYEKMQAVSMEVMNIEKNLQVGEGKNTYKAVSDSDVIREVKKAEQKHRLISIPTKVERVDGDVILSTPDQYGKQSKTYVDNIKMTVEIIDLDDTSQRISIESFGKGIDTADKGFGKACTYARKYALLNAYKIFTGEDPDKDASPPENDTKQLAPVDAKRKAVIDYLMTDTELREKSLSHFSLGSLDDLSEAQIAQLFVNLKKKGLL